MKPVLAFLTCCALSACMGGGGGGSDVSTNRNSVQAALSAVDATSGQGFGDMLNAVRSVEGANPVTYDARLGAAAQGHANDMLSNGFFSHTGSNGSTIGQRVTAQNYVWNVVGENIGRGQRDEEEILRGWVNSPGHQENNVDPRFEDYGLARAGSGSNRYWVLVLAREAR